MLCNLDSHKSTCIISTFCLQPCGPHRYDLWREKFSWCAFFFVSGKQTAVACSLFQQLRFCAVGCQAAYCGDAFAAGDVAGAIEQTWSTAKSQIQTVVNKVVFPVVDMILAILFFVKLGTAYFDYRKHGQFEFTAPAILFACLIFTLTAPLYIWSIL